jgi:NADH-quinone oxidoreductase subunit J
MTTRPRLEQNKRQVVGLLAFGLFGILSAVFLTAEFGESAGFPGEGSITASIGYAMFDLQGGAFESEGFLITFFVIALVLDAALDVAVMLGSREGEEEQAGDPLAMADGGSPAEEER